MRIYLLRGTSPNLAYEPTGYLQMSLSFSLESFEEPQDLFWLTDTIERERV
jgi:hypothetical protein